MENDRLKRSTIQLPLLEQKGGADALERGQLVNGLYFTGMLARTPCAIALNGEWGSGKTYILDLLQRRLKGEGCPVIWFDLWEHEGVGNPLFALSEKVLDEAGVAKEDKLRKELITSATLLGSLVLIAATTAAGMPLLGTASTKAIEIVKRELLERYEKTRTFRRSFESAVQQLLAKASANKPDQDKRLFILVDDVDRCFPDHVSILLSSIKHYLNVPNCVFVVGLDKRRTLAAVSKSKGLGGSEDPWLDKLFAFEVNVPIPPENARAAYVHTAISDLLPESETRSWTQNIIQGELHKICTILPVNPRRWNRVISEVLYYTLAKYAYQPPEIGKEHKVPSLSEVDKTAIFLIAIKYYAPALLDFVRTRPELMNQVWSRLYTGKDVTPNGHLELEQINGAVRKCACEAELKGYFMSMYPAPKGVGENHVKAALERLAPLGLG